MADEQDKLGKIEISMTGKDAVAKTDMPLRLLVLGDFAPDAPEVSDWETSSRVISVTPRTLQPVMQQLGPRLSLDVPNRLGAQASVPAKDLTVELSFTDMKSFRPGSVALQVSELAELLQIRGLVSKVRDGELSLQEFDERIQEIGVEHAASLFSVDAAWLEGFHKMLSGPQSPKEPEPPSDGEDAGKDARAPGGTLDSLLDMVHTSEEQTTPEQKPGAQSAEARAVDDLLGAIAGQKKSGPKADKSAVETIIDELDATLGEQISEILHHSKFQQLESAWRGLKFLMDRTDFRGNIKIELLSAHKDELRDAIYHQVFMPEYNEFTETPLSVMMADYEFDRTPEDMELLGDIAQMAASIQVPFIASAGPAFFGSQRSSELATLPMLRSHFQGPEYAQWNALRDVEDSQYIALTMPRFLLRLPYGPDGVRVKEFDFIERADSAADRLWGNGAFAVATTLVRSFMEDGWCVRITGQRGGGAVENLPVWTYRVARRDVRIPLDASFTQSREKEFVDSGFILLSSRINDDKAIVLSAPTIHRPKKYATPEETMEAQLHATLPYQLFATRMAHYLRRITDEVSTGLTSEQVQMAFAGKLRSVLAKPDVGARGSVPVPPEAVVVEVSDNKENPDYYDVVMRIQPPFQILGRDVSLLLGIQLHR